MSIKNTLLSLAKDVTKDLIKDKLNKITTNDEKKDDKQEDIKENVEEEILCKPDYPICEEMLNSYDFSALPKPQITNPDAEKTFLMVDDIPYTKLLFKQDFKTILPLHGKDIENDFKIVECFGNKAGWMAYKYAVLDNNKIDYGMFDITLGHVLKYNERIMDIDGIDIAYHIKNKFESMKFLLFTAHSLNKDSAIINRYITKLKNALNINLQDVYLNKNSDRYETIYKLLYDKMDNE